MYALWVLPHYYPIYPSDLFVYYRRLQQVQTSPTSMFSFVGGLRRASELSAAAPILVVHAVTALQAVCTERSVPIYSIHNHSTSLQTLITHSHTAHTVLGTSSKATQPQRAANEPPPWLHGCGSTIYRGRLIVDSRRACSTTKIDFEVRGR